MLRALYGIGAGLIKIRGDKVWRDLTAMDYHYETQPLPNPVSYFLHQAPKSYHRYDIFVSSGAVDFLFRATYESPLPWCPEIIDEG